MRWIRILTLSLALSLVGWSAPGAAVAGEQDHPKIKMVSPKKTVKKPPRKTVKKKVRKPGKKKIRKVKKKPKKKQGFVEPKWAIGIRGGATPASDMDVIYNNGTGNDRDPRLAFGVGVITQYRIFNKPSIYILGEFTHWWQELKDQATSAKDNLVTIATGVRFNIWGQANKAYDRVYVKGLVGYTYYAANSENAWTKGGMGASDRSGIYFGGGVGLEHLFKGLPLSVFVDTGVYAHNFSVDPAKGEKESSLVSWEIGAGLLYHF